METFLRCYVHACPSKWLDWLSHAEYWYNTSTHSAIGCSSFEALYGYTPKSLGISSATHCRNADLSTWAEEKKVIDDLLWQHLHRAQQWMKHQADKNRQERTFQEGDSVYIKLQPYVQVSLVPRANQKPSFKFFGPFEILSKIGPVAYKLELPASSSIHPIFHVSQLKKALPSSHKVSDIIPVPNDCWQFPEQVLAKKMVSRDTSSTQQVLIKWSGWPEALATWEDLEALHQCFPGAPAWGQARSLGGRMSVPLLPSTLQGELGLGGHLSPTFLVFIFLAQSGTGPINCVACVSLRAHER
jgi:hypothetical protein